MRTAERSPQPNVGGPPGRDGFSLGYWAMIVTTGISAGLAAGLLMKLLRFVQHTAWRYETGSFLDAVDKASTPMRLGVLAGTGVFAAVVLFLTSRAKSAKSGKSGKSGELEATIWFREGRLPPLPTVIKAVFSIVVVGLGASLGREAAPKQAGALIGSLVAGWAEVPPAKRRLLAACGAGAGIAAVYNVPFGAALFTLEVMLGSLSLRLVAPVFVATLSGTAAGWLLLPNEPTYAHIPPTPLTASLFVWALLFAPFAGLAAALFVKLIAFAARHRPHGLIVLPATILVFALLGALALPYPQLLGNGKDIVELAALGKLALPTLVALMVLKPLATAACLGTGTPGGLFTPTLAFGALLGGVLGHFWLMVWPAVPPTAFALIGAGAVLAATTKGPISALALVLELTNRLDGAIVPLLLSIALATTIASWLDERSTYTSRLDRPRTSNDSGAKAGQPIDEATTGAVSAAASYDSLLRLFLGSAALKSVDAVDERGQVVGKIARESVVAPTPRHAPLEIATAMDFVRAETT